MERSSSTTVLAGNNKMNSIYIRPGIINTSDQKNPTRTTTIVDDSAEISIFDAEKYFNELNILEAPKLPPNKVSPSENIIAGAGRIVVADNQSDKFSSASSSVADGYSSLYRNYRTRSFRSAATPTASSEASWNSQTGLLSVQPGSMSVSLRSNLAADEKTKKKSKSERISVSPSPPSTPSNFRWLSLRKKCPCSCKKSVQVKDKSLRRSPAENNINLPPTPPPNLSLRPPPPPEKVRHESFQENWYRTRNNDNNELQAPGNNVRTSFTATTAFSFPILKAKSPPAAQSEDDPARNSLEIFRPASSSSAPPPITSRRNSETTVVRPDQSRPFAMNGVVLSSGDAIDDGASDASSDLFEIESFSTATTATTTTTAASAAMFLYRRDSLEAGGGGGGRIRCGRLYDQQQQRRRESLEEEEEEAETECCYEPSEASIDWSVTTAEGFDRASVAYTADFSEFSEAPPARRASENSKSRKKSSGAGGGLLMSCRCEKAVNVGRPVPVARPAKPSGNVGPGAGTGTLAMWAVGHKL